MRLLDLFCGGGGAGMGYHQAGFEVVGVDINPQPHYPFEFHQADALQFLEEHGREFDVIHASPPCQAYTGMRRITISHLGSCSVEHPDLIAPVRQALEANGRPWVMENVQNSPLNTQFILCGASLGLPHVARHRHFEASLLILGAPPCAHYWEEYTIGVYGRRPDGRRVSCRHNRLCRIVSSIGEAQNLLDIDWMDWNEIKNAVPPAYTRWIGQQLLAALVI